MTIQRLFRSLWRSLADGSAFADTQVVAPDCPADVGCCCPLPHLQVQNSISTELLPQAAAAAAAAEQLLGASPGLPAAAAGMLSPRAGVQSPFAAVDAEVFVCSPRHPSAASSPMRPGMQQQHHHRRGGSQSRQQQQAAAALERQLSRVVSAKPSFAQPIAELRLVGRWVPGICQAEEAAAAVTC
jgi:hypothetical protein